MLGFFIGLVYASLEEVGVPIAPSIHLFFQAEVFQKLVSALLVRFKFTGVKGGDRRAIGVVDASRTHTHVIRI